MPPGLVKVGAGLVLTAPFTPMLFMGEEWGADTPWQYFTDHDRGVAGQGGVRRPPGRVRGARLERRRRARPAGPARRSCAPSWTGRSRPATPHAELLAWYRELIALRRARPELTDPWLDRIEVSYDEEARWLVAARGGC